MRLDYASRMATGWLASDNPEPWRVIDGSAVLADLTGFTRLTESLAAVGPEGAEILHHALTLCFTSMLAPSLAAGGDIVGFAGDAALVWFEGDGHEIRAVESAVAMPFNLARLPAAVIGGRRLRLSVGVHTGSVTAVLAGSTQRGLLLCGPEISELVTLEAAASAGQVLISPILAERLPRSWIGPSVGPGVEVHRRGKQHISGLDMSAASTVSTDADPVMTERLLSLLSPSVRELMTSDIPMGDHRSASLGFVAVPGVDALLAGQGPDAVHAALDKVATTVARIGDEYSVAWLDSDVGVDSVKLLLAAGAPQAVDDDEHRLLLALRRILDESDIALRAGAQRGRVFAGALGVPCRRTFTVIGDAVNVAARALGFAADRQLVVGDGLGVADLPSVNAVGLGLVTLRNRGKPVEMWQVISVQTSTPRSVDRRSAAQAGMPIERARIAAAWNRAVDGRGGSLSVIAEAGMGASDLLAESVERAGLSATFVVGDPHRQQIPYGTITVLVQALAKAAAADDSEFGWTWLASHVAQLDENTRQWMDDGRRAFQRQPRADEIDPLTTARRSRTVLAALIEAAAPHPWLLAVDHLDAIDDASRLVLVELRRLATRNRWLLLTSSRPEAATLTDETDAGDTIILEPFSEDVATQFVVEIAPRLRDDQVARIVAAGKGNRFVLAELARNPQGGELPDSLERLGAARIDALPVSTRRLVRDASAFGMTASLAMISAVLARPDLDQPEAWQNASSVLQLADPGTVSFRHAAYRIAAHESLPYQRRRELHSHIADYLGSQPGANEAVLAQHLQEAGRVREAFPLAVAASRSAKAAGAFVEAGDLLDRAVRMARQIDRPALSELLVEQGDALMQRGDLTGADRAFAAAGRVLSDPLAYAAMCSHRADLAIRRSQFQRARAWAHKGLSLTAPLASPLASPHGTLLATSTVGNVNVRGKLLLDDAAALYFMGRHAESLQLATQALSSASQSGSRFLEGLAHLHLEMVHSVLLHPEANEHGDSAVRIFESIGHDRYLGRALINSGLHAMHEGRWDEALDRYRRAADIVARTGETTDAATVHLNTGFLLLRQGRLKEADTLALRALRAFDTSGFDLHAAYARHLRSRVATAEGRFTDAEVLMTAARGTFKRLGDRPMVVDCDVASVDHLLRAGRPEQALALAERIRLEIDKADEAVDVSFRLFSGIAEARTGDLAGGATRVVGALQAARRLRLMHEEYLCLAALVHIETEGGPTAPAAARSERDAIAASLSLIATNPGPS